MPYVLAAAFVSIAVVLFIFTGIWGGLVWVVVAGLAVPVAVLMLGGTVERERREPTGTPRKARGGAETANERVGQT
jgi:hypothetical protein